MHMCRTDSARISLVDPSSSSGLAVQNWFQNHKKGQKSAWVVKKYGLRLMPELYEYLNPMPFEAASQMEKDLAEDLRADGYTVAGGT
jgi:hypothetical protein